MDVPGQHFLARPAFARDDHRRVVVRRARGELQHLPVDVAVHLDRRHGDGLLEARDAAALPRDLLHLLLEFLGQPHHFALNVVGVKIRTCTARSPRPRTAGPGPRPNRYDRPCPGICARRRRSPGRCRTTRSRWRSPPSSSTPARRPARVPPLLVGLGRIVPGDFHEKPTGRRLHVERLHDDPHHPLQRLHARSGPQPIRQAVPLEDPLHRGGVRTAPEIAEPREHAPGLVHAPPSPPGPCGAGPARPTNAAPAAARANRTAPPTGPPTPPSVSSSAFIAASISN